MKIVIITIFIWLLSSFNASAQDACPFGLANDPAPGACARYTDKNGNSCCDYSGSEIKKVKIDPAIDQVITGVQADKAAETARYKLVWIALSLFILHAITWLLVKAKKIKLMTHRRIWNILLLLSFLSSALLGLLLIIRINWGWTVALPFNMLYWHVETATAMAVITLFHLSWYWRFYTVIFKRNEK